MPEPVRAASTLVATANDTKPFGHEARDGRYAAAVVHELAEQGAEQKQREELRQEGRRAAHEGLRPVGEQRLQREGGGKQSGGWSEQEHAPAAQREPYEQRQSEQDPDEAHGVRRLQATRRGRRWSVAPDRRRGLAGMRHLRGAPHRATCTEIPTRR